MVAPVERSALKPLLPIRIFLSSPGDLFPVRAAIKRLVEELNRDPHYEDMYKFILYAYEDRVPPVIAEELQPAVDRYTLRPDAADIVLCLFWKRLGSPTVGLIDPTTNEVYPSGTVYELITAYRTRRHGEAPAILLYRCTAPAVDTRLQTPEQERDLEAFLARFRPGGDLIGLPDATFTDASEHASDLVSQLKDDLIRGIEVELRDRLAEALRRMVQPRQTALLLPQRDSFAYVERADALDKLRSVVLGSQRRVGVVAVHGQGGIGKTVLAKELCFDRSTRGAFPDGILWAELGMYPDVLVHQHAWIDALGGDPGAATTIREGTAVLQTLLQDRAVLLVLDNVWQQEMVTAFLVGGERCRLLLTTRDIETAGGAYLLELGVMQRAESIQVLREAARADELTSSGGGHVAPTLDDVTADAIAERLGDLPLALELVGRQLQQRISWTTIRERLDRADVGRPGGALGPVYAAIASSVAALPDGASERFHELAIFPASEALDREAVAHLWAVTAGFDRTETELRLGLLRRRALVQLNDIIHDLVGDYLRHQFRDTPDRLRTLHRTLAVSYGEPEQWPVLPPTQTYAWRRLAWHLAQAGQHDDLRTLLTDATYLREKIRLFGTEAAARDCDLLQGSRIGSTLAAALRLSAHVLDRTPDALPDQLVGRLGDVSDVHHLPESTAPTLRLMSQTLRSPGGPLTRTFEGHTGGLQSCAIDPSGHFLATAAADGTVRLWVLTTGQELRALRQDGCRATRCAFSPRAAPGAARGPAPSTGYGAEHLLAAGYADGSVRLWDWMDGRLLHTWKAHDGEVRGCTFRPDGMLLATSGTEGAVRVWDRADDWESSVTLQERGRAVEDCAFSADGHVLACACADHLIRIWDVTHPQDPPQLLEGHTDVVTGCVFIPQSHSLASTSCDRTVRLWDLQGGAGVLPRVLRGHTGWAARCAISPQGDVLVTASYDGSVRLWDPASGALRRVLHGHSDWVLACAIAPDARWVVSASSDGSAHLWDTAIGDTAERVRAGTVEECAFSRDGHMLYAAVQGGSVHAWEIKSPETYRPVASHGGWSAGSAVTSDGSVAALVTGRGNITLSWAQTRTSFVLVETPSVTVLDQLRGSRVVRAAFPYSNGANRSTFSADGGLLATVAWVEGRVRLWETATGTAAPIQVGRTTWVWACAFSPQRNLLVAAHDDGTVRMLRVPSSRRQGRMSPGEPRHLASVEEVSVLSGHSGRVRDCAFDPTGRLLVSASADRTVRLWEVDSGQQLAHWQADAPLLTCAWHPAQPLVVVGDALGNVHFLLVQHM